MTLRLTWIKRYTLDELKLKKETAELLENSKVARAFKFYFNLRIKVNKALNKFAKSQLDLSNNDLKLLSIVKDPRKNESYARSVLGVDFYSDRVLKAMRVLNEQEDSSKPGLMLSLTDLLIAKDTEEILKLIHLGSLTDEDKVEYLIGDDDTGMKNALSGVRNYWKTIRAQSKNWKRSNYKEYLIEAKTIIEEAFVKDEFTYDHFKRIVTALYLAIKARLRKPEKESE